MFTTCHLSPLIFLSWDRCKLEKAHVHVWHAPTDRSEPQVCIALTSFGIHMPEPLSCVCYKVLRLFFFVASMVGKGWSTPVLKKNLRWIEVSFQ